MMTNNNDREVDWQARSLDFNLIEHFVGCVEAKNTCLSGSTHGTRTAP